MNIIWFTHATVYDIPTNFRCEVLGIFRKVDLIYAVIMMDVL